ncbi:MAG: murein biosynthesis integral membrane protein MurJ, partial [Desulfobacterales bacterium]
GILQLLLQLPVMTGYGLKFWHKTKIFHPGLKKMSRLMPPVIIGGAVYQINVLVGTLLGSFLPEGSVTVLYFADRLVQFPLGIFAIAAATAVLPSLSRQAALQDLTALKDTFSYAVRLTLFLTIPSMVGLIILRKPIITVLFQRGEFSSDAALLTAQALLYYAIGLWAFSTVRIVAATFFAIKDTRTPMVMATISIFANMVLGIVLMKPLAHGGLALATSLASVLNLMLLVIALRKKLGSLGWRRITQSALKTLGSATVMGAAVWLAAQVLLPDEGAAFTQLLAGLLACVVCGIVVFGVCSYGSKSPEFANMLAEIKIGLTKKQSILISLAVALMFSLLFFIIFGEHGFIDLNALKAEKVQLNEKNDRLTQENFSLSVEIDRLKHDPHYIENVARQELGMVGENELILKPQRMPKP